MSKIFVHHRLKRAELKRLTASPPEPPPPTSRPVVDVEELKRLEAERARRACERIEARSAREAEMKRFRFEVDLAKSIFKTVWVESRDFCNWMKDRIDEDPGLAVQICDEQIRSLLIDMLATHESKQCVYCNGRAIRHSGDGWAALMISTPPERTITKGSEVFTYLLCKKCGKLPHKTISYRVAETLVRKVRQNDMTRSIRKSEFTPFDIQYFGDRFDVLLARNKEETIGFFRQLKNNDMLANPEILDEFA